MGQVITIITDKQSNTIGLYIFSLALISGILSFLLIFIMSFSMNRFFEKKSSLTSLGNRCITNNFIYESKDVYEIYRDKNIPDLIYGIEHTKTSSERCMILPYHLLKLVSILSYLLLSLSAVMLVIISLSVSTGPTKYLYITYFKERNLTVTIQVSVKYQYFNI